MTAFCEEHGTLSEIVGRKKTATRRIPDADDAFAATVTLACGHATRIVMTLDNLAKLGSAS